MHRLLANKWTKVPVFLLCLLPLGLVVLRGLHGDLTANPVEFVQHFTGDWTLRFLVFTLAVTPLRKLLNLPELIRYRRMLGLFAFFYLCLHFLTYIGPDQGFSLAGMWKDVAKRRFITVGFLGFVLLIPLAITSTKGWIRRLGGRRWQLLHRLIYAAAICGVIHYYWLVKSDVRKPLFYGALVGVLLLWRVADWLRQAPSRSAADFGCRKPCPNNRLFSEAPVGPPSEAGRNQPNFAAQNDAQEVAKKAPAKRTQFLLFVNLGRDKWKLLNLMRNVGLGLRAVRSALKSIPQKWGAGVKISFPLACHDCPGHP